MPQKSVFKKTVLLILLTLIIPLTASGCWNRREIQEIDLATAFGIDRVVVDGRPKFLFSALVKKPCEAGGGAISAGGSSPSGAGVRGYVLSTEGDTIYDAIRNNSLRASRQLFMSHAMVVVIGEDMAREGIGEIVDFCLRQKDTRERAYVVVCEGLARDALQAQPELESLTSIEAARMIERNPHRVSKAAMVNLFQVMYDLLAPGKEAVATNLKTFVPPETGSPIRQIRAAPLPGQPSGSPGGAGGGTEVQAHQKAFSISGTAVFRGDQLAGRLDEDETMGMLFIRGEAEGGIIPIAFDAPEKNASYLFRGVSTRVRPLFDEDGSILFEVRIKGNGELLEEKNAVIEIGKDDIKKAEELINQETERRCLKAVARCQELKSDVFGFGEMIYRSEPKTWEALKGSWGDIFPTVTVSVKSDFRIEHFGLISNPIVVE